MARNKIGSDSSRSEVQATHSGHQGVQSMNRNCIPLLVIVLITAAAMAGDCGEFIESSLPIFGKGPFSAFKAKMV
jgi:hypothetical protein